METPHARESKRMVAGQTPQAGRRRFIRTVGAAAVAVPAIESVTGRDLLTMSARAQTIVGGELDGPMTGSILGVD